ncbi:TraB/GumN family protein [Ilyomonas limi]|uniref:TraB/GumN family protein n=1 Tax=Ilyomonas limi TaxID=2575867 RepID=A0A4U3KVP3_9BACT|nr:TraB/GumN family protein [Ilyomonas limi]TKK65664.1 TraB/GumN family protein [Ilyomonas limi]
MMKKLLCLSVLMLMSGVLLFAQQKKYPSLFWEITGNGLQKPSYLFGTMHVSNKMVFHLSDSFYIALQQVDVVALEQNPYFWQRDMMQMNEAQDAVKNYMTNGANDYLNEQSFRLNGYEDNLRAALTDQPMQINGLLYRTSRVQEDYEENTYLDLYIYQTGRKLGKLAAGVEDYYESQRMVFQAYQAAAKEQNKKRPDRSDESMYDIQKKIQDAYRRGDLDMLDSLEQYEYVSPAFTEIFLYKRNEVQANSIDTILHHHSLFVGVGAAHLPGKRGVIELLRKKGYHLRPIYMTDRDADKKDAIDKMRVPVVFKEASTSDGFIQMQLPGPLFRRNDSRQNLNDSWQYADMDNGTYYMLTRVKTHAAMYGQTAAQVLKKVDSLLYENIPGKILKKTPITKNGYKGFDIVNRTRRGDMQRYNIIVTPFEVLVFKMSGNEDYVAGAEGDTFFNSTNIQNNQQASQVYTNAQAGFRAALPQMPYITIDKTGGDHLPVMACEAIDSINGNAYMIWKKTVNNYRFLEADTFDLSLIEESVKESDIIDKELSRSFAKQDGYDALNMQFRLKKGNLLFAKAVLRGPHYYLLAVNTKDKKYNPTAFFDSFKLIDFAYNQPQLFNDTSLHYTVQTPVKPVLDTFIQRMVNEAVNDNFYRGANAYNAYWNRNKTAFFQNDSTGEAVLVNCTVFPKYYYSTDTASFWKEQLNMQHYKGMIVKKKEPFVLPDSAIGYKLVIGDTNTVRQIVSMYLLKKNYLYQLTALTDTVSTSSNFINSFFTTFRADNDIKSSSVFQDKTALFFNDYISKDSAVQKLAVDAIPHINYTCKAVPMLQQVIASAKYTDKDYFDRKNSFIHELGYLNDSSCVQNVTAYLLNLYRQSADTSYFQNEIVQALARLKTASAYDSLKNLLLQDPPVYDDNSEYHGLFNIIGDSLALARNLFPDLLQLASLEGYKEPVNSLLKDLVDSGFLAAASYQPYFSRIYFDAKIAMKKQQIKDDKLLQQQSSSEYNEEEDESDDNGAANYHNFDRYRRYYDYSNADDEDNDLVNYATLLIGFYNTNASVPPFFNKLLRSQDEATQLGAAILLARNNIAVPDTVWQNLAAKDKYRAVLYRRLAAIDKENLFPKSAATQPLMAQALLLNDKNSDKFQSCELIGKRLVTEKNQNGYVYFFKYKLNKEDDWKIGISGIQPANLKEVNTNDNLTRMTGKRLASNKPIAAQYDEELKKLLFAMHKSATYFFSSNLYSNYLDDYTDSDN